MENCIFCKIVKGDVPSAIVYEDKKFLAFLDIMPLNHGHTLIIPKKHYETVLDMPKDELKEIGGVVKDVTMAISQALAPDGFNIFCNNKKAAGQEVPHLHFHIAPRYRSDGHSFRWIHGRYRNNEMSNVKEKIVKFL